MKPVIMTSQGYDKFKNPSPSQGGSGVRVRWENHPSNYTLPPFSGSIRRIIFALSITTN
jgi:hypothetical protein